MSVNILAALLLYADSAEEFLVLLADRAFVNVLSITSMRQRRPDASMFFLLLPFLKLFVRQCGGPANGHLSGNNEVALMGAEWA